MNNIGEKLERTLASIEDAIHSWQSKVRRLTNEPTFRAIPFLAKKCNVTTNSFYNIPALMSYKFSVQGEKNGCKLSLDDLAEIIVDTEDLGILETLETEIINKIKIKKNK